MCMCVCSEWETFVCVVGGWGGGGGAGRKGYGEEL